MIKTDNFDGIQVSSFKQPIRLNAIIAEPVKEELKELFSSQGSSLILDLKNVTFIDSSGFGVFLSLLKIARNNQGIFKLCNLNEDVMELFKILQLHTIIEIYPTIEDAIQSISD